MTVTDVDLEFERFFARGERITDAADVLIFARTVEARGHRSDALQLYTWTDELLAECPEDADLAELRLEVDYALRRLSRALQRRTG